MNGNMNEGQVIKRRYTEDTDGTRHCLVTYQREDGSRYSIQAY